MFINVHVLLVVVATQKSRDKYTSIGSPMMKTFTEQRVYSTRKVEGNSVLSLTLGSAFHVPERTDHIFLWSTPY